MFVDKNEARHFGLVQLAEITHSFQRWFPLWTPHNKALPWIRNIALRRSTNLDDVGRFEVALKPI
jgi:hypothetical protein